MLRIYRRIWQVTWAEQWQYRANSLMYLLYWLVSPIVYMAVWTAVARGQGSVGGLTPNDFVTYYLTLLVVDVLTSETTIYSLSPKIQDGTLGGELLKPMHPILTTTLVGNVAFKGLILLALAPIWAILCLLMQPNFAGVTLQSVLLGLPAVVLGFCISFLLGATITCVAFWTTRVFSLYEFYYAFITLFAGQFVPLELMPPVVRQVGPYLPFQYLRYYPVQLILGRVPLESVPRDFAVALIWLVISLALFLAVWRAGVKRFSAVGA